MVTQPSTSLALPTSRLRTRISHLRSRSAHLTILGLFPRDITISHNQELHGNLDHIASLEAAGDRQGQEKEAQDDMDFSSLSVPAPSPESYVK